MIKKKKLAIIFASVICMTNIFSANSYAVDKKVIENTLPKVNGSIYEIVTLINKCDKNNLFKSCINAFLENIKTEKNVLKALNDFKKNNNIKVGEFKILKVTEDEFHNKHYKAILTVDSIQVYGSEVLVHVNSYGKIYSVSGKYDLNIQGSQWKSKFKISKDEAIKFANNVLESKLKNKAYIEEPTVEVYLYKIKNNVYPVYMVDLKCKKPKFLNMKIFVNGENGDIIDKYDALVYNANENLGED